MQRDITREEYKVLCEPDLSIIDLRFCSPPHPHRIPFCATNHRLLEPEIPAALHPEEGST